jgi:acyl phosphate:glycerol-3-phosphate acyltransferase
VFRLIRWCWKAYRVWVAGVAGYLLGGILTADLVSKAAAARNGEHVDLRSTGSGNPGAANAMANLGTGWGAAVLVGDIAKGAAGAQAGRWIAGDAGAYAAGIGAVAGHCFPAFANFKGGKGVATSAGTTIVCFPAYIPIDLGLISLSWFGSRHVTFATLAASAAFTGAATAWWKRGWPTAWGAKPTVGMPIYAAVTSAIIAYRFLAAPGHLGNRRR